jgi:hypothetical protein
MSTAVQVDFPPLLEHDASVTVASIIDAATLRGQPLAGTIDRETVSRLLLNALGVDDVQAALAVLDDEQVDTEQVAEEAILEAARELRQAVEAMNG